MPRPRPPEPLQTFGDDAKRRDERTTSTLPDDADDAAHHEVECMRWRLNAPFMGTDCGDDALLFCGALLRAIIHELEPPQTRSFLSHSLSIDCVPMQWTLDIGHRTLG